ncbi:hypothetical protein B4U79_17328 [Dinothrombium tinctorium]|uniref:N-acetyltransferase domain-containing protein n=1 Tax=Dinothrombium tinctorium TaxID=1965070 RepID=A0A3S3Q4K6_9ACAR|nr:hypothetical protein B4U79_17402 [Dinothrombium tinctorium]RWS13869.1 hypothetical protein B4U79_17329 [Dinothrombium tinctorium]RWS13872.1 hypothetical protein B4U79_17328 [Dinothrombium tinctorium]
MSQNCFIRHFTIFDVEEVASLYAEVFLERAPTFRVLNLTVDVIYEEFTKPLCKTADERVSFVCEDLSLPKGKNIIAFRLSKTFTTKDNPIGELQVAPLYALTKHLKEEWVKKHPEIGHDEAKQKNVLHFMSLGVKKGYENLGIASRLANVALKQAKALGFKKVVVQAISEQSQYVFLKKFNFKDGYSIDFKDFEFKGRKPFSSIEKPNRAMLLEQDL